MRWCALAHAARVEVAVRHAPRPRAPRRGARGSARVSARRRALPAAEAAELHEAEGAADLVDAVVHARLHHVVGERVPLVPIEGERGHAVRAEEPHARVERVVRAMTAPPRPTARFLFEKKLRQPTSPSVPSALPR